MQRKNDIPKLVDLALSRVSKLGFFRLLSGMGVTSEQQEGYKRIYSAMINDQLMAFLCLVVNENVEGMHRFFYNTPDQQKSNLLLLEPRSNQVIKNQRTGRLFLAKNALCMVTAQKQIRLIQEFNGFFSYAQHWSCTHPGYIDDANAEMIARWKFPKAVITAHYKPFLLKLIQALSCETFLDPGYPQVSEATEKSLSLLQKMLTPAEPIDVENTIDVEVLLLASHEAYEENYNVFKSLEQRDIYHIRVMKAIAMVQSLHPCDQNKVPFFAPNGYCESSDVWSLGSAQRVLSAPASLRRFFSDKNRKIDSFYKFLSLSDPSEIKTPCYHYNW